MSTERALLVGGPNHLTEVEVRTDDPYHNMMSMPELNMSLVRRECDDMMMRGQVVTYQKRYRTAKGLIIMEPVQ